MAQDRNHLDSEWELGQVVIRASAVSEIHGLVELALGPHTVKDDAVEEKGDDFDDDLD